MAKQGVILFEGASGLDGKPTVVIAIKDTSNRKTGSMVQNADGTDRNTNIVYAHLKDLFKKVNDEHSDRLKAFQFGISLYKENGEQ